MAPMFRREHRRDLPGDPICRRCLREISRYPHAEILDLIAEHDKVVVRNHWTGTEAATGRKLEFYGMVIWRVAHRQLVERWAYLTPPQPIKT